MRLAFVADVHLGNFKPHGGPIQAGLNERCRNVLSVLERAVVRAKDRGCKALFVLGDLFDTSRPEPQIIAAAQAALSGIECYVLLGNHDAVSTAGGDHALGPLDGHDLIQVVEKPTYLEIGGLDVLCVPYRPGDAREYVPQAIEALVGKSTKGALLLTHAGLIDGDTPPWLKDSANAIPRDALSGMGLAAWLSGDWHQRKLWGNVMQVGTLSPHSFSDEGMAGYGTIAIFDTEDGLSFEELPGPRFLKLKAGAALPKVRGCQVYLRVTADSEQLDEARVHGASLVNQGLLAGFEASLDDKEVQAATRAAAGAARSAETMEESLAGYVREMPLEEGVDRAAVLERCRSFLR